MKCSACGFVESKVIDSRSNEDNSKIRRRRECLKCGARFTTYEIVETTPLIVVKKDRSRQPFSRAKLIGGLLRACEKRPVSLSILEAAVDEIELYCQNSLLREISSIEIGELAMKKLKEIDLVAYVRFASVYREYADINSFIKELDELRESF
jgi:transcriptional repressor NrdR